MKIICKYLGGSYSYGLQIKGVSDLDYRGCFIHTDVHNLIGLGRFDHLQKQTETEDQVYNEFRHNLNLLKRGNSQSLEMLWNQNWLEKTSEWDIVIKSKEYLIDSERLFSCLRGYIKNETRLFNGERQGRIGGKRKEAIDNLGYSPKNVTNLFRLAFCGETYFQKGYYPVNIKNESLDFWSFLIEVKTAPDNFKKDELTKLVAVYEDRLVKAYESRKYTTKFNDDVADRLCLEVYGPLISRLTDAK